MKHLSWMGIVFEAQVHSPTVEVCVKIRARECSYAYILGQERPFSSIFGELQEEQWRRGIALSRQVSWQSRVRDNKVSSAPHPPMSVYAPLISPREACCWGKEEQSAQNPARTYLQITQSSGIGVRSVSVCGVSHVYVSRGATPFL